MKYNKSLMIIFIINCFFKFSKEITVLKSVTFGENAESELEGTGVFKVEATYNLDDPEKYLYIYPKNYESQMYLNKANIKIYFNEISNTNTIPNYLKFKTK